jgi:hypothetical protein
VSSREDKISDWLNEGRRNHAKFHRSPFHDSLRTDVRDHYTNLIENFPKETLAEVEKLLQEAKVIEPLPSSMSASRTIESCWVLKTQKNPKMIKVKGYTDYAYRFIVIVLNTELMSDREVVRHLCHNRACVCPDHLQIGSYQENRQDEYERVYSGRDSEGRDQKL